MKRFSVSIALLLTFLAVSGGSHAQGEFPNIKGPYLGQEPPGLTPKVFAPGIVSTKDWEIEPRAFQSKGKFHSLVTRPKPQRLVELISLSAALVCRKLNQPASASAALRYRPLNHFSTKPFAAVPR